MYHIAIVEDEAEFSEQLCVLLRQYQSEYDVHFKLSVFQTGEEILKNYQPVYDLILLDIEMPGMKWVVIVLFCILPMLAWVLTQYAMHHYSLSGDKMKEIQSVNAVRKQAVNDGMKLEDAMERYQTLEDVPEEFQQK